MRFGFVLPGGSSKQQLALAELAEASGWDEVFVWEGAYGVDAQLDRFAAYYNDRRPHRGIGRRTPMAVFSARERAHPCGPKIDVSGYRVRRDKVDKGGGVTLRHQSRLHHIGIGRAYRGWRVILLVAGREVQVLGMDGSPLRRLTLDPETDYQRMP